MFNVRKRRLHSAEFAQLVECCRFAFAQSDRRPDPPFSTDLDWNLFLNLARRHRVQGLAWRSLHQVRAALPPAIAQALEHDAQTIARDGMKAAAECLRMLRALSLAGVATVFVKGLPVGALAYGDPFVKMSWDIDILIGIDQLLLAETEFDRLGYELVYPAPGGGSEGLRHWHESRKESVWQKRGENIHIELHTRLTDQIRLLPEMGASSAQQRVTIAPGIVLPTLAADELFAYLCVHGASSAWFRLKWLADVAGLLKGCSSLEISRLYQRSQELGAGRAAAQALLLARDVFGTPLETTLARSLEASSANRWLARTAGRQMTSVTEPTEVRFGTAAIHLTQFRLLPGIGFKLSELRRQLSDAIGNRA